MADARVTMTDGGIETVLLFHDALDLPDFAAFPLLYQAEGRAAMARYFEGFLRLAAERDLPLVLGTPTWRASEDWGRRLGFSAAQLAAANADAVAFVRSVAGQDGRVRVEGTIGPRGDGYAVTARMKGEEAAAYHDPQAAALADGGADRLAAMTLTYPEEAVGVVRAGTAVGLPTIVSFTVEVDGRLPDGTALADAIARVDDATDGAAAFFMVNCAHPDHIARGLGDAVVADRVRGLRVNASRLTHAELDEAEELDEGDPEALGRDNAALRHLLPRVEVLGGCCGTDARHVAEIHASW